MKKKTLIASLVASVFAISMANAALPTNIKLKNQPADLKTIAAADLPNDSTVFENDKAMYSLKASWNTSIQTLFGVLSEDFPLLQVYQTGPMEEQTVGNVTVQLYPMSFIYRNKNEDKIYCYCNAYGMVFKGRHKDLFFDDVAFDENTAVLEVTGEWKPKPKKSAFNNEKFYKRPIKKAELPTSSWNGPKIEPQLKKLMEKQYPKYEKIIIRSQTWEYEKNLFGVVLSRSVVFDIIYEGKTEDGKKAYFYRAGYVARQASKGNDFDKTFVLDGVPMSNTLEISDWK